MRYINFRLHEAARLAEERANRAALAFSRMAAETDRLCRAADAARRAATAADAAYAAMAQAAD